MRPPLLLRLFPILENASLANAVTLLSAALGASGLLLAAREQVLPALLLGIAAIPCDVFDGAIARWRGTASSFGADLDSLADATSFCLLPALLGHALALPVWAAPLQVLYALAGIGRLARFSQIGAQPGEKNAAFEGFPTPHAAAWFYVTAAVAVWLPPSVRTAMLASFYAVAAPAMICALRIPKRGWHTRLMWVLVPLAAVSLYLRLGLGLHLR